MKEENGNEKKKPAKNKKIGEKKFYLFTAIGCAVALLAIIIVAVVVSSAQNVEGKKPSTNNSQSSSTPVEDPDSSPDDENDGNKPVVSVPEGMVMPIAAASVGNDYGFYHNTTLNNYYVHKGVDFMAEVGAEVFAVEDGVVESIYKDDLLLGTEIVVSHEGGLKSVYRFVTEAEGLKVGDSVKKGDVIATVAEPTGNEYKDGAHLHFELVKNGVNIDPATQLTLEEK